MHAPAGRADDDGGDEFDGHVLSPCLSRGNDVAQPSAGRCAAAATEVTPSTPTANLSLYEDRCFRRLPHPLEEDVLLPAVVALAFLLLAGVLWLAILAALLLALPVILVLVLLRLVDSARRLSAIESLWLPASPAHCLFEVAGPTNVSRVREIVSARLIDSIDDSGRPRYRRLRCRCEFRRWGGHVWVEDPNFDVRNHVVEWPLQRHDRVLKRVEYVAPLDPRLPPWEIAVSDELNERVYVHVRVHPSLADGPAAMHLFAYVLCDSVSAVWQSPRPSPMSRARRLLPSLFSIPLAICRRAFCCRGIPECVSSLNEAETSVHWAEPYLLAKFIRIKEVTRTTIPEVVLTLMTAAIRSYQRDCGVRNPAPIPALLPVETRTSWSPTNALDSRLNVARIQLRVDAEGSVPRLWTMREAIDMARCTGAAEAAFLVFLESIGLSKLANALWRSLWTGSVCTLSTMAGPAYPATFDHSGVSRMFVQLPQLTPTGLSVCAITYAEHLELSIRANRSVLAHPQRLAQHFRNQTECMWELLIHRRLPGEHLSGRLQLLCKLNEQQSTAQLQSRLEEVQAELADLRWRMSSCRDFERASVDVQIGSLRAEFCGLLTRLRYCRDPKTIPAPSEFVILEEDGSVRRPSRRRKGSFRKSPSSVGKQLRLSKSMRLNSERKRLIPERNFSVPDGENLEKHPMRDDLTRSMPALAAGRCSSPELSKHLFESSSQTIDDEVFHSAISG